MLTSSGEPRLACGSICHTDSAKAYKQLDQPEGPLYDGSLAGREFHNFKLARTNVRRKSPRPEFAKDFTVKFWDGSSWSSKAVVSSFRKKVGKQPFNTED